jgi:biopolymer transport protein ExbD
MRIPGQSNRAPALQGEAMTPMIDVVFLLLVFFVCASVGQLPDSLLPAELGPGVTAAEVDLPPLDPEEAEHQEVRVGLRPGKVPGTVALQLNAQPIPTAAELRQRLVQLADIDPLTRIVLDIDDEVSTQQFISIYDLCQALDFQAISFGVRS